MVLLGLNYIFFWFYLSWESEKALVLLFFVILLIIFLTLRQIYYRLFTEQYCNIKILQILECYLWQQVYYNIAIWAVSTNEVIYFLFSFLTKIYHKNQTQLWFYYLFSKHHHDSRGLLGSLGLFKLVKRDLNTILLSQGLLRVSKLV